MTTNDDDDLQRAIDYFKSAEANLVELASQTEAVLGAGQRLAAAEQTLDGLRATVAEALERQATLAGQLAGLAGDLADAADIVRGSDPSRMFEAIERLTADFERQKERVNEMAGEIRVRTEEFARSVDVSIADSAEEMIKAVNQHAAANLEATRQSRSDLEESLRGSHQELTAKLDEHSSSLAARITTAERSVRIPVIIAAALSGLAVVLLVVILVTS